MALLGKKMQHISKMRSLYKEKCLSLVGSLTKHCSDYLNFEVPDGGAPSVIKGNSEPRNVLCDWDGSGSVWLCAIRNQAYVVTGVNEFPLMLPIV